MNDHALSVSRLPDSVSADGMPSLGWIVVTVDAERLTWPQTLDVLRLIADGSPRRSFALYYTPAAALPQATSLEVQAP